MKLTHKAIAMNAGYHLVQSPMRNDGWYWESYWSNGDSVYSTEQEAWEACCTDNGLVEEEY